MTRELRTSGLAVALVAWALAGGATVSAQAASSGLPTLAAKRSVAALAATPSGYMVVVSGFMTAPNGSRTRGVAVCPPTRAGVARQPQGGGVVISSGSTGANVASSFPYRTTWIGDVTNASGADTTFQVYAVCAKPKSGYALVATFGVTNPAGSQTRGTASCPTGTKVLGGGVYSATVSLGVNINSSFPNQNGWAVDMNNATSSTDTFDVYAVCSKYSSKTPPGYAVVIGTTQGNVSGTQSQADAICPAGESPLGGGGYSDSLSTSTNMNSTFPIGSQWGVFENNGSSFDSSITAVVICAS